MYALGNELGRRTTVDDVFDRLHADIVNLKLEPGTRMSEVEIAGQFNTSRQPVREAFIRLSNMRLLEIRPQKATLVRKISHSHILNSRFIRTAVEVEVVRRYAPQIPIWISFHSTTTLPGKHCALTI